LKTPTKHRKHHRKHHRNHHKERQMLVVAVHLLLHLNFGLELVQAVLNPLHVRGLRGNPLMAHRLASITATSATWLEK
jgi:hypothetical protein